MRHLIPTILGATLITGAAALTGCEAESRTITMQANGVPFHENSAQDWWNYQFIYHPNIQAYYQPYTGDWFWFQNDAWHAGPQLPNELTPKSELGQVVKLQSDHLPFMQHGTVLVWEPLRPMPMKPVEMDPTQHPLTYGPVLAAEPTN